MECYQCVEWETLILCWIGILATRDLRSYFTRQINKKKTSHAGNPKLIKINRNVAAAGMSTVNNKLVSFSKKKGKQGSSCNISKLSRAKEEVRKYTYSNRTYAATNNFKLKYPKYTFFRTSIHNWNCKFNNQKENLLSPIFSK